ncbi:TetR family transcriptional regulator [Kiloniella spongiae]|uniref:TetR family transcriptional regulator n=1 Tax=Kiloniella spongiae TaxID=1489064 RepID=A0A0H2MEM7_9PROT|nr:TetR/AcrR family transcriptional regulator [Kiloniella spongiae]KLN60828.1 TetR family transcriptional regulator [Kiloniella spongiae]
MRRSKKRDHLVDVALGLFYTQGFHATGVEQIVSEAGVARMTLYKHFPSKDDLILAALERRDEQIRQWLLEYMEAQGEPKNQLLAMYDALELWFNDQAFPKHRFSGCMFINAVAEFSDFRHKVHEAAARHKAILTKEITGFVAKAGFANPDELAAELMLLKEGAIVTAQVSGDKKAARRAKKIAVKLLAEK